MGRSVRQICPTGEKTHWQAVPESHTVPSGATVHDAFPPFPPTKKKERSRPNTRKRTAWRTHLVIRSGARGALAVGFDDGDVAWDKSSYSMDPTLLARKYQ